MDPADLQRQFAASGVVRLDRAFSPDAAVAMRRAVWAYAERKVGLRADDPATWPGKIVSWKGLKRNRAFAALIESAAVVKALDALFEPNGWTRPKPGAQILLSLPQPGPWVLPDAWHMDCGFERPSWPVPAVKLFAFFGDVGPDGGGTMLLPGTHRLVDRYRETLRPGTPGGMVNWKRFIGHDPWLAQVLDGAAQADRGRSMVGARQDVGGIPVEVMELTGCAGDVVITHLHVFHTVSPNVSDRPRQMLGKTVTAATDAGEPQVVIDPPLT